MTECSFLAGQSL